MQTMAKYEGPKGNYLLIGHEDDFIEYGLHITDSMYVPDKLDHAGGETDTRDEDNQCYHHGRHDKTGLFIERQDFEQMKPIEM